MNCISRGWGMCYYRVRVVIYGDEDDCERSRFVGEYREFNFGFVELEMFI